LQSSSRNACPTDSRIGFEPHHEALDAVGDSKGARRDQFDPIGPRRYHLDWQGRRRRRPQDVVDHFEDRLRRERLRDQPIRLTADRFEECFRRVIGGDHHHARRVCEVRDLWQHVEAAHSRQTDVEQHHVKWRAGELGERREAIGRLHDEVAALRQNGGHREAKGAIVIDNQNPAARGRARSHWTRRPWDASVILSRPFSSPERRA